MGKHLYNILRVVMAVLLVAGLLGALEISILKEHASPLNWKHFATSVGIVGVIIALMWEESSGQ